MRRGAAIAIVMWSGVAFAPRSIPGVGHVALGAAAARDTVPVKIPSGRLSAKKPVLFEGQQLVTGETGDLEIAADSSKNYVIYLRDCQNYEIVREDTDAHRQCERDRKAHEQNPEQGCGPCGIAGWIRGGAFYANDARQAADNTAPAPVASPSTPTTAAAPPPSGSGDSVPTYFVSINGGVSTAVPSLGFCEDNAVRLGRVGATQGACGLNGSSGAYGASAGLTVAHIGAWDLIGAGGFASFGRTRPEAEGTAPTFTVSRRAQQRFRGGFVGGGLQRTWPSWMFRSAVEVAYLRRVSEATDTFTRLSDRQVVENGTSRTDTDVQPMVNFELYRRAGRLWFGTGYRFTQFEDDVTTQRLHSVYAALQIAFGS